MTHQESLQDRTAILRRIAAGVDAKTARQELRRIDPADLAEGLAETEPTECAQIFKVISTKRRAEVFSYLPIDRQEDLIRELPETMVTPIVNDMEPDDRTRLLEALPFEVRSKILLRLSPEERKIAWQLLSYPENSIGRLMTPEFLDISPAMKVSDVMEMLRWSQAVSESLLNYLYVTDEAGKYLGEVSLPVLVTADPPGKLVGEIMNSTTQPLVADHVETVAVDHFRKYDRSSLPVVDAESRLIGIVTADDVFDVAEEEATEDIQQFGGQATLEDSYFQTSIWTLFRKRVVWLMILFAGGTLTAAVLKHYEHFAGSMTWLIFFLPLIVSAGGNTGSQSASLVIRGIAVRELELGDWHRVLWREALVGLALGLVLGVLGYFRAVGWHLGSQVGLTVAASVLSVVAIGAFFGAMLPFMFKRLKLDPAVISSPLLAQSVDVLGVIVFYNIAWVIFSRLNPMP